MPTEAGTWARVTEAQPRMANTSGMMARARPCVADIAYSPRFFSIYLPGVTLIEMATGLLENTYALPRRGACLTTLNTYAAASCPGRQPQGQQRGFRSPGRPATSAPPPSTTPAYCA